MTHVDYRLKHFDVQYYIPALESIRISFLCTVYTSAGASREEHYFWVPRLGLEQEKQRRAVHSVRECLGTDSQVETARNSYYV